MCIINKKIKLISVVCIIAFSLISCSEKTGNLLFTANGEEFIVNGLVSKEGWKIDFENVLVNIDAPEAYNNDSSALRATLKGDHLVDLKRGTAENPVVSVGIVSNLQTGNYQSLKFSLKKIKKGENEGFSIIMKGKASKEGKNIPFVIKLNEELTFDGKEGYVGDSLKGLLKKRETADVEMTFHFDHIFGNIESGAADHVNSKSPGFQIFLDYAEEGGINVNQNQMKENPLYNNLISGIETLGHLGEGHCEVSR